MPRTSDPSRSFWLTILVITFTANLMAARLSYLRWNELGVDLFRSIWGVLFTIYLVMIVACVWLLIYIVRFGELHFHIPSLVKPETPQIRVLGLIIFLVILFLIPYIKFTFHVGQTEENPLLVDAILMAVVYYWLYWYALLLAMTALKVAFDTTWQTGFASALVLLGVVYEILIRFNAVTTYPLSMGWSEGSRYYYASLYFSKWLYGKSFALSTLHPTRYFLQSIPFLIPSLGLPFHRLWQFLLWIVLTAGAAITLSRRAISPTEKAVRWLVAGWYFLFLLRVGVYYHLEVMAILPLLFVSTK